MSGRWLASLSSSLKTSLILASGLSLAPSGAMGSSGRLPTLYVGTGVIAHQILKTSGEVTGSATPVASIEPEIHAAFRVPLGSAWAVTPSVAFTVFGRTTEDGAATVRLLPVSLELARKVGGIEIHGGPGVLSTFVAGEGGTIRLNNGTSTSTFARPSGTSAAVTLFFGIGAGGYVGRRVRVDGTVMAQSIASGRRTFSILGQVSYEVF